MIAGLWTALKGWSIWPRAQAAARSAGHWLAGDFWRIAALITALSCAVLLVRIEGLHVSLPAGSFRFPLITIEGLKERATKAEAALAAVKKAQGAASAAQAAANHEPAQISRAIAEASDAQSKGYLDSGRAAASVYAAANSVRGACPEGGTGGASVPGADSAAAKHDSAGDDAEMVAVTRADFDSLTGSALRLAQVHQDAQALIDAGVAVPSDGEPPPEPPDSAP